MPSPAAAPARELSSIDFRSMIGGPLRAVIEAQAQAAMTSVEFIKAVGFLPANANDPSGTETEKPIYVSFKYPRELSPYVPEQPARVTSATVVSGGGGYTGDLDITLPAPANGTGATLHAVVSGGAVTTVSVVDPGSGYTGNVSAVADPNAPSGGSAATFNLVVAPKVPAQAAVIEEMFIEVPILTMLPIPFIRVEETTIDFNAKINSIQTAQTNTAFKLDGSLEYKYGMSGNLSVPVKAISLGAEVTQSVNMKLSTSYQRNTQRGYKVERTYSMNIHVRAVQDEMPAGLERLLGILEDTIISQPAKAKSGT